jgi:hypothetical protein
MDIRKLILIISLIFPVLTFGQRKHFSPPRKFTKRDYQLAHQYNQCFYKNKYNAEQRHQFFPFNTADTIRLVSFEAMQPNYGIEPVKHPMDTVEIFIPLAVNNFKLNTHRIIENKLLRLSDIDSLTNLMYNVGFLSQKAYNYSDLSPSCYNPRNAILFINSKGVITQYIEFCFGCRRYFKSSSKIVMGEFCEQKFELLKKYFLSEGLQYGTVLPKWDDN